MNYAASTISNAEVGTEDGVKSVSVAEEDLPTNVVVTNQKECLEACDDHSITPSQAPTPANRSIQNSPQPYKKVVINSDKDDSNNGKTPNIPQIVEPLSWHEARTELSRVLEEYLRQPTKDSARVFERSKNRPNVASLWITWDLDLYFGALVTSISLLLISCFSLLQRQHHPNGHGSVLKAKASIPLYREQVAASSLLVLGSLVSIWAVRRRRYASSDDAEHAKRRVIVKFLKELDKERHRSYSKDSTVDAVDPIDNLDGGNLAGTSLTDIYPAYRLKSGSANGRWHRLPTLLLVKGDLLALQIGDMAPANCRQLDQGNAFSLKAGERLRLETCGATTESTKAQLPRGRSSLPKNAKEMLTLCNRMQIFVVEETPIQSFLNRPIAKPISPQIHRKLQAIRSALALFSVVVFILTAGVLFARRRIVSSDISLVLPLPFLAMMGVVPVMTPVYIFSLEIIGTARILAKVDPHLVDRKKTVRFLILRYVLATFVARFALESVFATLGSILTWFRNHLQRGEDINDLEFVRIPTASTCVLEKLGVVTAFTLVDDDLVCNPYSIPQQLLIPSSQGFKLLDLCPTYDDDSDEESATDGSTVRKRGRSFDHDSDSDSDDGRPSQHPTTTSKRLKAFRRRLLSRKELIKESSSEFSSGHPDVQFEDPLWWQFLPSLKCIGLGCLLVDERGGRRNVIAPVQPDTDLGSASIKLPTTMENVRRELIRHVCAERSSTQLRSLAQCIGFSTEPNTFGRRGDISPFTERLRMHVNSADLLCERLKIDTHAIGSEQARWWGLLRPDTTSVVVQDARSKAYQLLTVGDPRVVSTLCQEAWQGENSTILPFGAADRAAMMETSKNWMLADLDVTAFSYAPVPHTLEIRLLSNQADSKAYLVENSRRTDRPVGKEKVTEEWSLINNQIFLGILGSSVTPKKEIRRLLDVLNDAGVRFVYFSPRNMRRQKELASQMGIDVAWNCAISLRPLDAGDFDPHRMVSTYADWDVNAKLPHGIDDVRTHLKEVDNVPLLVSLFTDVTKETTTQMVQIFQEYGDIVVSIGLSHLSLNSGIFGASDLSIGIDVINEDTSTLTSKEALRGHDTILPEEVAFVSAVSSHSCAFRLMGSTSISQLPSIIAKGRAALHGSVSGALFIVYGSISYSIYVLFATFAVSTVVPFVPFLASVLLVLLLLPTIGIAMVMSHPEEGYMEQVPPKNDQSVVFGRKDGWILYCGLLLKAIPVAAFPHLLHLIAFGELAIEFDRIFVSEMCNVSHPGNWIALVRCEPLRDYSGTARASAGTLAIAELVLCLAVSSAGFVSRAIPLVPWSRNYTWGASVLVTVAMVATYLKLTLESGSILALPWYYFLLAATMPFLCLGWNEFIKRFEEKHHGRAEKLRRLQFETRLGMWSPK